MNPKRALKVSALAAAVSLACGSTAFAQEDTREDYGQTTMEEQDRQTMDPAVQNEDYQAPSTVDQAYESAEQDREAAERAMQGEDHEDPATAGTQYGTTGESGQSATGEQSGDWQQEGQQQAAQQQSAAGTGQQALSSDITSEHNLGKFAEALKQAGLEDALADGTSYTVFAPTDEAFEQLSQERGDLMEEGNVEQLREVLRSHIVAGTVDAEQAKQLDSAQVLTGATVPLSAENGELQVADAKIVESDINAGNLTIHTIDRVLDPDSQAFSEQQLTQETGSAQQQTGTTQQTEESWRQDQGDTDSMYDEEEAEE